MSRRVATLILVVVAAMSLAGLMTWGMLTREPATARSGVTRVGKLAPSFALPLFDGGEFNLEGHRGDVVVVNFWASWCSPCRGEALHLERVWRASKERGKGVIFVGVNVQDEERAARAFLREFQVTYPNGSDSTGAVTLDYGVVGLPVTFFVDKGGTIARRWVGAIREEQLAAWIEELLAGVSPSDEVEGENLEDFFKLER